MPFDRQQVNDLFDAAVDLTGTERAEFLERECAGNRELRAEVESLLAADADVSRFMDDPILSLPPEIFPESTTELAGQQLGDYRIVREIGRGGLGTVYLAERSDDAYRKEVAIKLIRRGLDTEDILRRFRNERQILAQLEHPHIARLLDGGTTEDGQPFFVMEHVQGQLLLVYCEAHNRSINERLELFRKVCAAVTYAHQNLVIHRDLKPSNILVTAEGEPKLLDFGIARLLSAEDENLTLTAPAARVLTPGYASPEQIRGDRITTASDIYSLGVLLYEMLSGQKPYRLKSGTSEEMARAIAEQEPERPSRVAAEGNTSDFDIRISKFLQGDLDNIVLMALRKEPERRYASVERFSEDIHRHLAGLPVSAHKDTLRYRTGKFIRRNKAVVLGVVLLVLVILAGITGTLWQSHLAQVQRVKAERRFNDVRTLANSFLFEFSPKIENLPGSMPARQLLVTRALEYLDSLSQESADDWQLQNELAVAYEKVGDVQGNPQTPNIGDLKGALTSYEKAQTIRRRLLETDVENAKRQADLAGNLEVTANINLNGGEFDKAEASLAEAVALREKVLAKNSQDVAAHANLGNAVRLSSYVPFYNS